jgi:hypothetical protein
VSRDVYAAAKVAAELTGRSVAEQLSHWAKVGREVEALTLIGPHERQRSAQQLLAGRDYDTLAGDEQALVRTAWDEEAEERLRSLDLAAERHAAGLPIIILDEDGQVVRHHADGSREGS